MADPEPALAQATGGAEERGPFSRMPGGQQATEETFVDLHEHGIRLGHLARWDRAAPLLALGTLLLGAGIGGWVAGKAFTSPGALASACTGAAFLVGGLLLREERVKSARDLHREWEGRLALYDDDHKVQAIKRRYKEKEQEAYERTVLGVALRGFRWLRKHTADRKAAKRVAK